MAFENFMLALRGTRGMRALRAATSPPSITTALRYSTGLDCS